LIGFGLVRVSVVCFGFVQSGSVRFFPVCSCPVRFDVAQSDLVFSVLVWFGSLWSVRFGWVQFGWVRFTFCLVRFVWFWSGSVRLGVIRFLPV